MKVEESSIIEVFNSLQTFGCKNTRSLFIVRTFVCTFHNKLFKKKVGGINDKENIIKKVNWKF